MAKDPQLLLVELGTYLQTSGVGTLGINLFLGTMPGSPQTGTVIVHTGGFHQPGNPTRFPSFTVQHRNTRVNSGLATVKTIHGLLDNVWNVLPTITGRIVAASEPGASFNDANGHSVFPLNYNLVTTAP